MVAFKLCGFRSARELTVGEAMKTQANFVERRERPRVGVMAQLEDITYSVLRKHAVLSGLGSETPVIQPITR